ncbi:MAG: OsmC family protein [Candidatus Omnitrophica bacterium]|nr:OsmC family protein [Candidatus Omnitrophota bacterium]MDD5771482.1 OsmC family protein [Candidatus Omnitrophota bacterium]
MMYKAEVTHIRDLAFKVKAGESELAVEAKGKGFTPLDALLAALGSCVGVYIRKYAEGKPELNDFKVNVSAELSKEPPLCFRQILVEIDLKPCVIDERRQKALLEFLKNCPVHNTLKVNPAIEMKLIC